MPVPEILWKPSDEFLNQLELNKYIDFLGEKFHIKINSYNDLRQWSVKNLGQFWKSILDFFNFIREGDDEPVLYSEEMPGTKWFPNLKLNYAENLLYRENMADIPIIGVKEDGSYNNISKNQLIGSIGALSSFLTDEGLKEGDRVASIMPNIPEAIIASLSTSAIGAIWSSSSPDFGLQGILERFSQIEPRILFAVDGYTYNGKVFDRRELIRELSERVKSIEKIIVFDNVGLNFSGTYYDFNTIIRDYKNPSIHRVKFEAPLWILYSSGTTGPPKAIVHGHGNILLEHMKLLKLHYDVKKTRKFFWYTTTGWMMWNVLLSSIGTGATAVTYDGSTTFRDNYHLWKMADELGISFFGTSAAYLTYCMREGLDVDRKFELKDLYAIGSTGSPLPPDAFRYVYTHIKKDVWLASISGGTDVCTAFLGGCPTLPVYEGELQCLDLGADIHSYDEDGNELINETGELVLKKPYISMPVFLWNDPKFNKYRETYFSKYEGIWNHGDWIIITDRETAIILGRSDATLKRKGIRIGTAEIYRVVERIPEVKESMIIGVELKGGEYYMPLFISINSNADEEEVKRKIVNEIKKELSPRHIPDEIIVVKEIPKTINGKKMEVPIKKIFMGIPVDKALNRSSMQNPWCIDEYMEIISNLRKKLENNL